LELFQAKTHHSSGLVPLSLGNNKNDQTMNRLHPLAKKPILYGFDMFSSSMGKTYKSIAAL
jgi:hypothetical protein